MPIVKHQKNDIMYKFNDLNPKNDAFHQHNKEIKNLISRQAHKMYEDKEFSTEYRAIYILCCILRGIANVASLITFCIAIYIGLSFIMPLYLAIAIGVPVAVGLELTKNFLWSINAKIYLKYKRAAIGGLVALLSLHLLSGGGSAFGAWQSTNLLHRSAESTKPLLISTLDVKKAYEKELKGINSNISLITKEIKQTKSNYTKVQLSKTLSAKEESKANLIDSHQKQLDGIRQQNEKIKGSFFTEQKETEKRRKARNKNIRLSLFILAIFFEACCIICSMFISYCLYRRYIDDTATDTDTTETAEKTSDTTTADTTTTTDTETSKGQAAPPIAKERTIIKGFQSLDGGKKIEFTKVCQYDKCKKPFLHNTITQKYCSSNCRKMANKQKARAKK